MRWTIWREGFLATGMDSLPAPAACMGDVEADTFQAACNARFTGDTTYDREQLTYWACRLFDNEADARLKFG